MSVCTEFGVLASCAADIPEEEARYWAKKLEQLNAMKDQDVRLQFPVPPLSPAVFLSNLGLLSSTFSNYNTQPPMTADLPD